MQTKNITNMKDEWAERPGRGSDQVLITHTARAGLFIFNLHRSGGGGGGGWHLGIFCGVCAARASKLAPRSKNKFP